MNTFLELKANKAILSALINLSKNDKDSFAEIYKQFLPETDPNFSNMTELAQAITDSEDERIFELLGVDLDVDLSDLQDLDTEDVKSYLEFLAKNNPKSLVSIHNQLMTDGKIFIGGDEMIELGIVPMCELSFESSKNSKVIKNFVNDMLSNLSISLNFTYYTFDGYGKIIGFNKLTDHVDFYYLAQQIADNNLISLLEYDF